jgi:hypothetical protein
MEKSGLNKIDLQQHSVLLFEVAVNCTKLMDDLARYIINYYSNLMTRNERAAHSTVIGEAKAKFAEDDALQRGISENIRKEMSEFIRKDLVSSDPRVLRLLKDGKEAFFLAVRDRILKEHSDKVFLNRCPRCSALARTPTAKQCPKCFFSRHGAG